MGKPCDTCTSRTDTACDKRPTSGDSCAGYTNAAQAGHLLDGQEHREVPA